MDLAVVFLLAVSTLSAAVLGITCLPWPVVLLAEADLALVCVTALQLLGFGLLSIASVTVACISINQIAYLVGGLLFSASSRTRVGDFSLINFD
jgi:hypothetical protein